MFSGKTWLSAATLDEAYEALQKNKANAVVGGCGWLKMTKKRIWTAVDLTRLGLDTIEETADAVKIGACVTLRQVETHPALQALWGGILPEAVRRIVGVQFRNGATVGASVWMRAGFSDLLAALLALDATVHLHGAGDVLLEDFISQPYTRDIVTGISVRKDGREAAYQSLRQTATDFPVLAVAVSRLENSWRVSVGARPGRAVLCPAAAARLVALDLPGAGNAAAELHFASNLRGSADYRRMLARTLTVRAAEQILKGGAAR